MKKSPLIKKHGSMVMAMMQATPQTRKKLVKDSPSEVISCVSECCQNVLKGNVHLSSAQKKLYPNRQHLRRLASKSISVKKKKHILNQKGGGVSFIACTCIITIARKSRYWWNRRSS